MKPRVIKPENGNPYYNNVADGGYNQAKGNPLKKNKDLTSLPNCVAIYGWFNEIGGKGMRYLSTPWYPYTVIAAGKREGLEVTEAPTAGGIMVWTGGRTGEGHVEGVAEVISSNEVISVGSEFYGRDWAKFNRKKGDGNWRDGCYWMGASYHYQGCIRNPFMEKDMTKEETEKLIKEIVPSIVTEVIASMEKERGNMPADKWVKDGVDVVQEAIEWVIDRGIMVGDASGNFRPQDPIKRQEAALVVKAAMQSIINEAGSKFAVSDAP